MRLCSLVSAAQEDDPNEQDKRARYDQQQLPTPQPQQVFAPPQQSAPMQLHPQQVTHTPIVTPELREFTVKQIEIHGWPSIIDEWRIHQDLFFPGYPALPQGWIRIWSRSKNQEYYYRVEDQASTLEWPEMMSLSGLM